MNLKRKHNVTKEYSPLASKEQAYLVDPAQLEIHLQSIDHFRVEIRKVIGRRALDEYHGMRERD
jgi:hypothetical protein